MVFHKRLVLLSVPFHLYVTAVARERSSHAAKSAGGSLQLKTHTSMTQRSRSGLTMLSPKRTHQGNKRTRNSSGTVRPQSFELA